MRRDSGQVDSPMNYVFTSAQNAAIDIINERKLIVAFPLDLIEDGDEWHDRLLKAPVFRTRTGAWNP